MNSEDNVGHPSHYIGHTSPVLNAVRSVFTEDCDMVNIECIQAMVSQFDCVDEIRGYLRGNAFKYMWRYRHKNGVEDLKKAQVYSKWLLQVEEAVARLY